MQPQSNDHTHPELEERVARLETNLKFATDILLDIRALLDTRLGALEARFSAMETRFSALEARFAASENRLTRIERLLDERLGRNGPTP